jgi:hypothetical protein
LIGFGVLRPSWADSPFITIVRSGDQITLAPHPPQFIASQQFTFETLGRNPSQDSLNSSHVLFNATGKRQGFPNAVNVFCTAIPGTGVTRQIDAPLAISGLDGIGSAMGDGLSYCNGVSAIFAGGGTVNLWSTINGPLTVIQGSVFGHPCFDPLDLYFEATPGQVRHRAKGSNSNTTVSLGTAPFGAVETDHGLAAVKGNLAVAGTASVNLHLAGPASSYQVVNTNTLDPTLAHLNPLPPDQRFTRFFDASSINSPGFQGRLVAFKGKGVGTTSNHAGIYYVDMTVPTAPGAPQIAADSLTTIPGTTETFDSFDDQTCLDNGRIAFIGGKLNPGLSTFKHKGIYIFYLPTASTPGNLVKVADLDTSVDFGAKPTDLDLGHEAISDTRIAFWAQFDPVVAGDPPRSGVYLLDIPPGAGPGPGPTLTTITVTPPTATAALNTPVSFVATGGFSDGTSQDLTTSATWSAFPGSGIVVANGIATASAPNTYTITATQAGISGNATLTITGSAPIITSITISPLAMSVTVGTPTTFGAAAHFSDGSTQPLPSTGVTWSTNPTAGVSITSGGVATATTAGHYSIIATLGTQVATADLFASSMAWLLAGNPGTGAADFLGTTDDRPLSIRTGNPGGERIHIESTGYVGIGTSSPGALFDVNGMARVGAFTLNQPPAGSPGFVSGYVLTSNGSGVGTWQNPSSLLPPYVAFTNTGQTFHGTNIFDGPTQFTDASGVFSGTFTGNFSGNGSGLTGITHAADADKLAGKGPDEFWRVGGNDPSLSTATNKILGTYTDDPLSIATYKTARIVLDTAGNVDIGQTVSSMTMNVHGKVRMLEFELDNGSPSDGDVLTFESATHTGVWSTNPGQTSWQLSGNSINSGEFLGTLNTEPLDLRVDNHRALHLQDGPNSVNVVGGSSVNTVPNTVSGAAIGGGGQPGFVILGGGAFLPMPNRVNADFGTISGGAKNTIGVGAPYGTVAGGSSNSVTGKYGVVIGGDRNEAAQSSLAAGNRAKARGTGSFVWADTTDADFVSTNSNVFLIRASGGVGINKATPSSALDVAGSIRATSPANALYGLTHGASGIGVVALADTSGGTALSAISALSANSCQLGTPSWAGDFHGPARFDDVFCDGNYWWKKYPTDTAYHKLDEDTNPWWSFTHYAIWTGGWSDARLKRDVATIPNAIQSVGKLRGVTYLWNDAALRYFTRDIEKNTRPVSGKAEDCKKVWDQERQQAYATLSKREYGFVAQEVEQVFPEWVTTDDAGYKRIDMQRLGAVLVNAINEQQTLIETQRQEIAELKRAQQQKAEEWEARLKRLEESVARK